MSLKRTILWSLLLSAVLWIFFSWPLPRYLFSGVPMSSTQDGSDAVRRMVPGDHLQLLYNYWIFTDMISGKTPMFKNVYEFNTGDDEERKYVGGDLLPFSLVFSAGYWAAGRAFGWNLMGFIAIWLSCLFMWLLLRNYIKSDVIAALLALLSIALPFRWVSLFGGSPTGLAMLSIPMLMWGLDAAIRKGRIGGGLIAAAAIIMAYWNDGHVFFFAALLSPAWAFVVLLHRSDMQYKSLRCWGRIFVALLPFGLLMLLLVLPIVTGGGEAIEGTTIEHGRSLRETGLFTPAATGLIQWKSGGIESFIYVGFILPLLIAAGFITQLLFFVRNPKEEARNTVVLTLIAGASLIMAGLALGGNGPWEGRLFVAARRFLPNYEMIRQPAKIFCLLPPFLVLATAMGIGALQRAMRNTRIATALPIVVIVAILIEYGMQIRPSVCLLDSEQAAYAAVAKDARERGEDPRVLIVPLWPGDSSWSSLYQHYVSLYRIRMINGYLPVVPQDYIDDIATYHEYANAGMIPDEQMNDLQERGIRYVILHEDAFPEQVSTFAVNFTIKNLLEHPRLELLKQGENIWAFKILDEPRKHVEKVVDWEVFAPSYNANFEAEWFPRSDEAAEEKDVSAIGEHFVRLAREGASLKMHPFPHCRVDDPVLLVRARGKGKAMITMDVGEAKPIRRTLSCNSESWQWFAIPVGKLGDTWQLSPEFTWSRGAIDIDMIIYGAGALPKVKKGKSLSLPGAMFFHAGYTDMEKNGIVLRPDYEKAGGILYGPKLPLTPGDYEVEIKYETPAEDGTRLGAFHVTADTDDAQEFDVIAGEPAQGTFSAKNAIPVNLVFTYSRAAPVLIREVIFTRTTSL